MPFQSELDSVPRRVFSICSMNFAPPCPVQRPHAPEAYREALAELVQIGLRVARMVGQVADAESALAVAASQAGGAEEPALAGSLAEAIEADQATAAAAEAQETVAARTETVARAFRVVSRSVRMTVLLAERLDRGWARQGAADDQHAMAKRQIARAVADAIGQDADGERAERLTEAFAERMEQLDVEAAIGSRPVEDVISEICRDLGLDPARMTVRPPFRGGAGLAGEGPPTPLAGGGRDREAGPKRRPPDG